MKKLRLHPFKLPRSAHASLKNGLNVHVFTKHELPLAACQLVLPFGTAHEDAGAPGVVGWLMQALAAETMSRDALSDAGKLGSYAAEESAGLSFSCLASQFDATLARLARAVLEPVLSDTVLERERRVLVADLKDAVYDPAWLADRAMRRAVWGAHPYARSARTNCSTLERMPHSELIRFRRAAVGPRGAHLCIVGDVEADEILARVETLLGGWTPSSQDLLSVPSYAGLAQAGQVLVIDTPDASEVEVRIAGRGVARRDPALAAIAVLNALLTEGFGSRLFMTLRTKKGLVYFPQSVFKNFEVAGVFEVATSTRVMNVGPLLDAALDELASVRDEGARRAEVETAKRFVIGSFPARFEANETTVGILGEVFAQGLTVDWVEAYRDTIDALSRKDVDAAAAEHLLPNDEKVIVLVGPRGPIERAACAHGHIVSHVPEQFI